MNSMLAWVRFRTGQSHSFLVDTQQKYLRNVILFGTGLSAFRQLFGVVITCQGMAPGQSLSQTFLDMKCYVNGTVTELHHDYYQFTNVFLFLLAFAVTFPYAIWSHFFGHPVRELEALAQQPELAIIALHESKDLFLKTVILEAVYALYWFGILFLTNCFFNGYWSRFHWSWKALDKIFPDTGNCIFIYYHPSGETYGSFKCLLPLSSVYRRVFFILYWIVAFLLPFHGIVLAYRAITWIRTPRHILERDWAWKILNESTVSWSVRKKLNLAIAENNSSIV